MRASVLGLCAFSGLWLSQLAVGQAITEFPVSFSPFNIVSGPDGNLWFTEASQRSLGRLSTSGVQAQIALAIGSFFIDALVFDADGDLWFTEGDKIGRMAPGGKITEFTIAGAFPSAGGVAFGSDHNIWFTVTLPGIGSQISRITSSGEISTFPLSTNLTNLPGGITAGPDGNIWFTEYGNRIARITPNGSITEFLVPGDSNPFWPRLNNITAGPDGALWFTDQTGKIGRITTSGVVSEFSIPDFEGQRLAGITSGPDGAVWFTEGYWPRDCAPYFPPCPPVLPPLPGKVRRITPDGAITEVVLPTPFAGGIRQGPDGNLWVAETFNNSIARIVPTAAACPSATNTMSLIAGRFCVSATWQSSTASGAGTSKPLTSNTGAFWFFDPTNLELVVKVLDGRSINGKFWVFYGSLTDVEFTLTVTDTQTGAVKAYFNPQGQLASVADTSAF